MSTSYAVDVKVVMFTPAVGYTSAVLGTSTHTYSFPEPSFIVYPDVAVASETFVNRGGRIPAPLQSLKN